MISSLLLHSSLRSSAQNPDSQQSAPFPNDPTPDPESTDTVSLTLTALTESTATQSTPLIHTIISELCDPTPHGPDGDGEPLHDPDLREKLARCVVNFGRAGGKLDETLKKRLHDTLENEGETKLLLEEGEWDTLIGVC